MLDFVVHFVVLLHYSSGNKSEYFECSTGVLVHKSHVANYSVKDNLVNFNETPGCDLLYLCWNFELQRNCALS